MSDKIEKAGTKRRSPVDDWNRAVREAHVGEDPDRRAVMEGSAEDSDRELREAGSTSPG